MSYNPISPSAARHGILPSRALAAALALVITCASGHLTAASAFGGPANWRRAYVVDAGLATLRTAPGLRTKLLKRLRHGRMVAIVGYACEADGMTWVRVAVTRRTRGWIPAAAIASTGDREGERRLADRLNATSGFARLELARLAIDHFPRLRSSAREAFVQEADRAAALLTKRAARRFEYARDLPPAELRTRMLLDPLLDRYVRLGVRFDADPGTLTYGQFSTGSVSDRVDFR